jgi:glycosyltransferase involved in cell wall biosynthesis
LSHHRVGREVIYVDATVMIPTLKKALAEPSGISRVGLQIVSSVLLDSAGSSRLIVFDPHARRPLCLLPEDGTSELDLMREISRIARSMQRSPLQKAWALARGQVVSLGRRSRQWLSQLSAAGGGGVFLFHGMNIRSGFLDSVNLARRQYGMKVVLFLHDLMPLTHPPQYTDGRAEEFRSFLARFIDSCDLVITSSRYTAETFPGAVARIARRPLPPVAVVPLAHEYRPWQQGSDRPDLPDLANHDFVLSVGSIQDRKNQLGLLRAWHRYRSTTRRPGAAHLVLAGPRGRSSGNVTAFLEETGYVDGTVHVLPQPTDPELTWLYRHCRFTAYVSLAEGWGLPIGESFWEGKTCMTSRTTAMPEVGGKHAVYVDPHSIDDMAATLHRLLDEDGYVDRLNRQISRSSLRTWSDFRGDLVDAVRSHVAIGRAPD